MKKMIIALVAGLVVASPAAAQYGEHREHAGEWNPQAFWRGAPDNPYERIQFLQDRVNRGVADGSLNRGQAARAQREINGVRTWMRHMHWQNAGQLTPDQRAMVQARLDNISRHIRWMRHDGW